jgi:hypothetical protein
MSRNTVYTFNGEYDGFQACDILVQHYGDSDFRTILLNQNDFENLRPWKLVSLLNAAYERGRIEYQEEFRRFIGARE